MRIIKTGKEPKNQIPSWDAILSGLNNIYNFYKKFSSGLGGMQNLMGDWLML